MNVLQSPTLSMQQFHQTLSLVKSVDCSESGGFYWCRQAQPHKFNFALKSPAPSQPKRNIGKIYGILVNQKRAKLLSWTSKLCLLNCNIWSENIWRNCLPSFLYWITMTDWQPFGKILCNVLPRNNYAQASQRTWRQCIIYHL